MIIHSILHFGLQDTIGNKLITIEFMEDTMGPGVSDTRRNPLKDYFKRSY